MSAIDAQRGLRQGFLTVMSGIHCTTIACATLLDIVGHRCTLMSSRCSRSRSIAGRHAENDAGRVVDIPPHLEAGPKVICTDRAASSSRAYVSDRNTWASARAVIAP